MAFSVTQERVDVTCQMTHEREVVRHSEQRRQLATLQARRWRRCCYSRHNPSSSLSLSACVALGPSLSTCGSRERLARLAVGELSLSLSRSVSLSLADSLCLCLRWPNNSGR